MSTILIADSGATKCEWVLLRDGKKKTVYTQGISPYFLTQEQIIFLLGKELTPKLKNIEVDAIHYYGTGLLNPQNKKIVKSTLQKTFPATPVITVEHDMLAVARATCGTAKGLACILGTGSNSCFYNGKKITHIRTGLGYVLGDEGSGSYLGKKVLQYYLYETFDSELKEKFDEKYHLDAVQILDHVYRQPFPSRYLGSFAGFLSENRGHYMIENIIEDGLNDFIVTHLYKFRETWKYPVHFSGGIAYNFKDVLIDLCHSYEITIGSILKEPMPGLIKYHS